MSLDCINSVYFVKVGVGYNLISMKQTRMSSSDRSVGLFHMQREKQKVAQAEAFSHSLPQSHLRAEEQAI